MYKFLGLTSKHLWVFGAPGQDEPPDVSVRMLVDESTET